MKPLVSICCLAYNQVSYIEDAIKGFLAQKTDFPFEIIINDDASTDGTRAVIEKYSGDYPDLIRPIFHELNQFSKDCRVITKFVLPKARGTFISLCEGDDYWTDPYKLQKSIDFLSRNSGYVACCHDVIIVDENGRMCHDTPFGSHKGDLASIEDQVRFNCIPTLSLVFRNLWGEDLATIWSMLAHGCIYVMDYPLKVLLLSRGKIKYFNEKMGVYRWQRGGGHSYSSQPSIISLNDAYCYSLGLAYFFKKKNSRQIMRFLGAKAAGNILLHYLKIRDLKKLWLWLLRFISDKSFLVCLFYLFTRFLRRFLRLNLPLVLKNSVTW